MAAILNKQCNRAVGLEKNSFQEHWGGSLRTPVYLLVLHCPHQGESSIREGTFPLKLTFLCENYRKAVFLETPKGINNIHVLFFIQKIPRGPTYELASGCVSVKCYGYLVLTPKCMITNHTALGQRRLP